MFPLLAWICANGQNPGQEVMTAGKDVDDLDRDLFHCRPGSSTLLRRNYWKGVLLLVILPTHLFDWRTSYSGDALDGWFPLHMMVARLVAPSEERFNSTDDNILRGSIWELCVDIWSQPGVSPCRLYRIQHNPFVPATFVVPRDGDEMCEGRRCRIYGCLRQGRLGLTAKDDSGMAISSPTKKYKKWFT